MNDAYLISRTLQDGTSGIIKVEYFNPDEFKITIVQSGQFVDAFTVVGINEAMSKCMFYQQKLFKKIVESADMLYEQLKIMKEASKTTN